MHLRDTITKILTSTESVDTRLNNLDALSDKEGLYTSLESSIIENIKNIAGQEFIEVVILYFSDQEDALKRLFLEALKVNNIALISELLRYRALRDFVDADGNNPFHIAAASSCTIEILELLKTQISLAKLNEKNNARKIPAQLAIGRDGCAEVHGWLLGNTPNHERGESHKSASEEHVEEVISVGQLIASGKHASIMPKVFSNTGGATPYIITDIVFDYFNGSNHQQANTFVRNDFLTLQNLCFVVEHGEGNGVKKLATDKGIKLCEVKLKGKSSHIRVLGYVHKSEQENVIIFYKVVQKSHQNRVIKQGMDDIPALGFSCTQYNKALEISANQALSQEQSDQFILESKEAKKQAAIAYHKELKEIIENKNSELKSLETLINKNAEQDVQAINENQVLADSILNPSDVELKSAIKRLLEVSGMVAGKREDVDVARLAKDFKGFSSIENLKNYLKIAIKYNKKQEKPKDKVILGNKVSMYLEKGNMDHLKVLLHQQEQLELKLLLMQLQLQLKRKKQR